MVTVHHLSIISGQEYRMPVRLIDAAGHAVPIADYDLYGAARRGSETTRMSVEVVDGSSCVAIIPPLEQASYTYDLYLRHRSTTAEVQILAGNIAVRGRVASMPPVTGGGEDVVAVVSADMTEVQVTVTPIAVATPDAWDRLDRAGDLLAEAIETAGALVPDAQRVIRQEVETGQSAIKAASADAVRQTGADIAAAGDREVASAADRIRAVSGQEAESIAAAGAAARQAVASAGSSATSESLAAIDDSIIRGTTTLNNATNNGINAIGQAVTTGTGTIDLAAERGKMAVDSYIDQIQADVGRYSKAGQWTGVQTFNAPVVFNASAIISSTTPLNSDPFTDQQRLAGLLDSQYLQAMYGGRPLPITYETHATDTTRDASKLQGMSYMQGKASAIGAWQCAWLTSQQSISGCTWIRANTPTGTQRRTLSRSGRYALNILPLVTCTDAADTHPPIAVGLNAFFTGHSANDNLPPLRWPWLPQIFPQPHHANWNQPKAIVCCEAYGHRIATILVYVGYGGSVINKDVTPNVILYNCIPCVRYKSPIADVSTITTFYFSSDDNSNPYDGSKCPTYIQTCDGQLVAVPGTPLDTRYCSMGVLAIAKEGRQASACIRDLVQYPNVKPATVYAANNVQFDAPIHPIETWLKNSATHTIVAPRYGGPKLQDKISIDYTAAAPEEYPYEFTGADIVGGKFNATPRGNYGKTLTVSAAAQDAVITCPAGWLIDVDDWSAAWCVSEGNTLHIQPNSTGATRYASVWIYAPTNSNNNSDGTNLVYEYIIRQSAQ